MINNGKDSEGAISVFLGAVGFFIMMVFICFVCSSCKLFREVNKSSKDSTSINNTKEGSIKFDSSGSKSDITSTKETIYYPQPIYIQGKDGEVRVISIPQVVKESGTEKTEQAHIVTDTSWRDAIREMTVAIANKQTETEGSLLSFWQIIGIAFIGIVFIGMLIALVYFKNQIVSIKTLLNK